MGQIKSKFKDLIEDLQTTANSVAKNKPTLTFKSALFYGLAGISIHQAFQYTKDLTYDLKNFLTAQTQTSIQKAYRTSAKENGEDVWVLVTGATRGIGYEYCKYFAKLGFSVILVARDSARLGGVSDELKVLNPNIKTLQIPFDFNLFHYESQYQTLFFPKIKDLDISIVVNNVGTGGIYVFDEMTHRRMNQLINVNVISQIQVTKFMIPKLLERVLQGKKAGIICMSATAGNEFQYPFHCVYGATKAFVDSFAKTLAQEYPQIDILSVRPGPVKTNLNKRRGIEPQSHVKGAIRFLGVKNETHGVFGHAILARYFGWILPFTRKELREKLYKVYEKRFRSAMQYDLMLVSVESKQDG